MLDLLIATALSAQNYQATPARSSAPDAVPELFQSTRWGVDAQACAAAGDAAPGLVVWYADRVVIEGETAVLTRELAKGRTFLAGEFVLPEQGNAQRTYSFNVLGQERLTGEQRFAGQPSRPLPTYRRCTDNPDREPPAIPAQMLSSRWGLSQAACRAEDLAGTLVFGPRSVAIDGQEGRLQREIAKGGTFLRGVFVFTEGDELVERELNFTVRGGQRLTYYQHLGRDRSEVSGPFIRCQ